MEEEVKLQLDHAKEQMQKAIDYLESELSKIRAGKANPSIVNGVKVDYYGVETPLNQVAGIKNQDAKTLIIQPWEKDMLEPVEKAILAANLGFTPQNDGNILRLSLPPLTEERRVELVKQVKEVGETSRVSIRNARRDANEHLKGLTKGGLSEDLEKDAEHENQQLTDEFIKSVDKHLEAKEEEIMTV